MTQAILEAPARISTGSVGLDTILRGGLPPNRLYLLEGAPGSGKTTLALKFLLEGVRCGERVLYVTLSETSEELEAVAASHGWSLEGVDLFELASASEVLGEGREQSILHPWEMELGGTVRLIQDKVEEVKPARIAFDSLSEMRLLAQDPLRYRRQVLALKQFFAGRKVSVLLVDDLTGENGQRDAHLHSLCHGVITLERLTLDFGAARRRLEVQKLRGIDFIAGFHDFAIRRGGLEIYPRLVASDHHTPFVGDPTPSGIAELDGLLAGGPLRGTSTLITGPAGAGKTTVALQYLHSACERGETALLLEFDERIGTLLVRAKAMGLDLQKHIDSGALTILQIDPAEISPGEFAWTIRRQVEERSARVIVIDSLNGYLASMPQEQQLVLQMHELLSYLNQQGVVTFLINPQSGLVGSMVTGSLNISYVADAVILIRFFEAEGRIRKAISIIKNRGGPHEDTIRELRIDASGVRIGEPLTAFKGVMTGTPEYAGKAAPCWKRGPLSLRRTTAENPVLLCAPFGRDGESVAGLLRGAGHVAQVYPNLKDLVAAIDEHIGAILVTEEALTTSDVFGAALAEQPVWSDIPVLLLISRQNGGRFPADGLAGRFLAEITNVILLERPLATRSLLSAVDVALRSRERQFALRGQMELLAQSREALEVKVQERTAELQQEVVQRAQVEAALRQSQKMEAVGQLTGGIAHDFNNMLTGVIGSLDIMRRRIASNRLDDLDRFMDAASASANRAAGLTQRLLAFSRRQSLDAKPTEINSLVASLETLIRGSVDERVRLQFVLDPQAPRAVVDANQLENALLNLAINARDAMPDGGQLTIETSAIALDQAYVDRQPGVEVGDYVVIAVSDTGVGMPPDVLDKVFDPFFTTKPLGQGTGLGLSMVYGFARQSGGQVRIHSQPGAGTSVKIFLPMTEDDPALETVSEAATPHGDGQRVLVVEDDPAVRLLVLEVLEELGFVAVEAADPHVAIPILASSTAFDLLISDVGLPGMNGRELAEVARTHRPDLPILFITGYAENAAIRAGFLGTNMSMVTKPFRLNDLAAKISEMMDAPV